ncbi:cell division protein SepF [Kineococcus rhizosphaerae]|uniref:Cell division protein SepF n=1 Tax=Kineococcus rhizosphaerae TaxID=559628 RepID=A0A2T0R8N6_9ACTN|nr:cell division protein SepF [Kineococcus rhizosphaerae]PRY17543.1 cell division inhibitor SepF [Kineococcus rhizosphaerae]
MAGALRNAMVYLGLAEDDRYAEDAEVEQTRPRSETAREVRHEAREPIRPEPRLEVRHDPRPEPAPERRTAPAATTAQVTPIRKQVAHVVSQTSTSSSSSAAELHRITTIHPRTYNEAKIIGESFREGVPVIMNLTDMDDSDAKRLVDFSAGLVFGLHGSIERVTNKVFLLSPQNVEVATQEEERPVERTFFNQS